MYIMKVVASVIINLLLVTSLVEGKHPSKDNNYIGLENAREENVCEGMPSSSNPNVDEKCPVYKVELTGSDKKYKGMSPSGTEVAVEAKNKDLVPILILTIFASVGGDDMTGSMPANLNALTSSLLHNAARGDPNSSENNYVFLKGVVADAFSGDGEKGDNKGEKDKGEKEKGGEENEEDTQGEGEEDDGSTKAQSSLKAGGKLGN